MSKVLNELPASASNNESLILQALNASNQRQVAEKVGIDASTLSRMILIVFSSLKTGIIIEVKFFIY